MYKHLKNNLGYAYRLATCRWRRMPDFIITGAQKAGTSSLFFYLAQHPDLKLAVDKELHYYNYYNRMGRDQNWYRSFFPLAATSKGKLTGEASPYYLFAEHAAKALKHDLPDIKLIALLRNPIDRAYSAYQMNKRNNQSPNFPSSFEQAINNENFHDEASILYLMRGHYAQHIKNWLKYFDREQFLFIKSEKFFADPHNTLKQCYDFLGVETIYPDNLSPQVVGHYSEISPELRLRLDEYFKDHNRELVNLLGEEFSWPTSPSIQST